MQTHTFDLSNILNNLFVNGVIDKDYLMKKSKKTNYNTSVICKNHELMSVVTGYEPPFYTHRYLQPTDYLDYYNYLRDNSINLDFVLPFVAHKISEKEKYDGKYGVLKEQLLMGNMPNTKPGRDGLFCELKFVSLKYPKPTKNHPNGRMGTLRIGDLTKEDLKQTSFFKTSIYYKLSHLLLGLRIGHSLGEMYYIGPDFWKSVSHIIDMDWASIRNGYKNRKLTDNVHTSVGQCLSIKQQAGGVKSKKTGKIKPIIKPFIIIQDVFLNTMVINDTPNTITVASTRPRLPCVKNTKYTRNLTPVPPPQTITASIF